MLWSEDQEQRKHRTATPLAVLFSFEFTKAQDLQRHMFDRHEGGGLGAMSFVIDSEHLRLQSSADVLESGTVSDRMRMSQASQAMKSKSRQMKSFPRAL